MALRGTGLFFFQMQVGTNTNSMKENSEFEHADAQTTLRTQQKQILQIV